jgi:Leucine-rich repeat (LRR) protein
LALHNNQIKKVEGLSHLKKLAFLDLSNNIIEDIDPSSLPADNLMILKLHGNPVSDYRKPVVLHLNHL